ncbi:hypothetical protein [Chlamydia sp. 17-3921]|uniref:hypothetical protein n=1 Tax=Chlamydia sp. 17-3921 TaxID=2675798 RepID=UPI001917CA17|nr:hypothetical protein [Chlamydia sp. 17-3921]
MTSALIPSLEISQTQNQQIEELFLYTPNKITTPVPWETCRKLFVTRSIVCFTLTILLALGATALASYAILNYNWSLFSISVAIILLSIIVALFLAFPIKNKIYGITLIDEISQDINNIGKQRILSYGEMFKQIKLIQIPELNRLHQKLCEKIIKNRKKKESLEKTKHLNNQLQKISPSEKESTQLSSTILSMVVPIKTEKTQSNVSSSNLENKNCNDEDYTWMDNIFDNE